MRVIESKDPQETVDYGVDWTAVLGVGETIDSSTWTVPAGLTAGTETNTSGITRIFLSGGDLDAYYDIENLIETSGGRTLKETLRLYIRRR